ncbi:MAG: hypothetical protein KDJ64_10335, partial [Nitratireductor sp.]|nr:hypothetical protein [Nitratireductor sp.]
AFLVLGDQQAGNGTRNGTEGGTAGGVVALRLTRQGIGCGLAGGKRKHARQNDSFFHETAPVLIDLYRLVCSDWCSGMIQRHATRYDGMHESIRLAAKLPPKKGEITARN